MAHSANLDRTSGQFTTVKLQALLDSGSHPEVKNRRDLAEALASSGARISVHGVEAWFRRVDSNYSHPRESLSPSQPSFALPVRHWPLLLDLFQLAPEELARADEDFGRFCLARTHSDDGKARQPLDTTRPEHLPGREAVFANLLNALQVSAIESDDCARLVLLEGAAGMGKTCLLEELVRRVRLSGGLCVTASCVESVYIPLLPLLDFVRLQIDEVARGGAEAIRLANLLVERIERANQQDERGATNSGPAGDNALFLLGSDLLVTLARKAPLVVVVDDMHWIDDATRDLLVHFATFLRLNRQHRVVLLLAGRQFNSALLHRLPTGEFTQHIQLEPLERSAMRRVARRLLGTPLGPQARDFVWNITQGNPLYVEQLTAHLAASQQLQSIGGLLELSVPADAVHVPENLDDHYRQRFAGLDREASRLLQLAACFGQLVNSEFLQLLVPGTSTENLLAALDRAETAGLLRFAHNAYEFCHPIARHAVYSTIPEAEKSRQHAQIAAVIDSSILNRSPHASIELAYHLVHGRPHTLVATTLTACREAAEHSHRLLAWPSAEYFATAALEIDDNHGGLTDDTRGLLLRLRGSSRHQTARPEVALQDLDEALVRFQSDQNTIEYARTLTQVVRIRANFSQVREGQNAAAEELETYVELLNKTDRELAANALEVLASYRLANNDSRGALQLAERAIDEFGETVEPLRQAQSRITAGISALNHLDAQVGLKHLLEATSIARENEEASALDRALQRLILTQFLLGRMSDLSITHAEINRRGVGATATGERSTALAAIAAALAVQGNYGQALVHVDDALELVDVTGYRFMETTLVGIAVYCLSRLGQHSAAGTAVERLEAGKPRRAARLLRACGEMFENHAAEQAQEFAPQLAEADRLLALDDRAPDAGELARLLMLGQLALASNDEQVLAGLAAKLRVAESAGFVFATAWPVQVPLLIGRICLRLGQERDAHYFLRRALDHSRLHQLSSQLRDLHNVLVAEWPGEQELVFDVNAALQASG